MNRMIVLFMVLLQLTGCSRTINAWNGTVVEEYYAVLGDDRLPQTLADKNVTFSCKEMIYSSVGHKQKCYVKKNTAENIDSWGEKILITTVTAVGETVENIAIVGFYAILGVAESNGHT